MGWLAYLAGACHPHPNPPPPRGWAGWGGAGRAEF
jgi:hypothetical protein